MPPRKRSAAPAEPAALIAPLNDRIRAGEQQYVAVDTKPVELALESYEHLAQLVEDGAGREGDVLREALAVGLRGMLKYRAGAAPQNEIEDDANEPPEEPPGPRPPPLPDGAVVLRPSIARKHLLGDVVDAGVGA